MNSSLITLRYCLRIIGKNCQSKSLKSHDLQHYQPQYFQGSDLLYIRVHTGIFVHHWAGSSEFWTQSSERMMTRLVRCPDRTVCSFRTKHFNETFSVLVYRSTRFAAATDRQRDTHQHLSLSQSPPPPRSWIFARKRREKVHFHLGRQRTQHLHDPLIEWRINKLIDSVSAGTTNSPRPLTSQRSLSYPRLCKA